MEQRGCSRCRLTPSSQYEQPFDRSIRYCTSRSFMASARASASPSPPWDGAPRDVGCADPPVASRHCARPSTAAMTSRIHSRFSESGLSPIPSSRLLDETALQALKRNDARGGVGVPDRASSMTSASLAPRTTHDNFSTSRLAQSVNTSSSRFPIRVRMWYILFPSGRSSHEADSCKGGRGNRIVSCILHGSRWIRKLDPARRVRQRAKRTYHRPERFQL